MNRTLNLDTETYAEFLRCVSLLKEDCNDADVRNGIIRQRSNEKVSVFEIDLTSLISDISLPISDLKQKIDLFKIFENQEVQVEVNDEEDLPCFKFIDQYSTLKFVAPRLDYIDNKFMTEEDLSASFILNESDVILNTTIPKNISDRIKIVTQNFNVNAIQINFEGETASLSAKNQSKDQSAKFYSGVVVERPMTCYCNMVTIPFVIDHDTDVTLKVYNIRDNVVAGKFTTTVGNTTVVVYTRSHLIEE